MLVNIPIGLQSSITPTTRPNYIEGFADGSGFVFNPENPYGVKYLPKNTFSSYTDLVRIKGNQPIVNLDENPEYTDFVEHGLAIDSGGQRIQRKQKPKALTVWFHISNACNLACSYCYIPKLMKAADLETMNAHFMSPSTAEKATESLFEFCKENGFTHLQIKFAGGEPTLNHELISKTCEYAQNLSCIYNVVLGFRILTNGVFIDDNIYGVFKKYKFGVSISLDGDKDRHDQIRFTVPRSRANNIEGPIKQGSWDIIDKTIDNLILKGIKPYILCTVTQKNYKHLLGLVEYCYSKKIGFRLSLIRDKFSHLKENLEDDILSELIKIYDWIGENLPCSMPIERFARFAEWNLSVQKQSVCGTCKSTMSIDQDGKVASCQMRMDKSFGNINNNNLTDIFDNIRSADDNYYLTNPNAKSEDCSVCYWKFTCAGGCPEHTRIAKGTLNSPSPWCHLYQDLLPHYIRAIARQIKRAID